MKDTDRLQPPTFNPPEYLRERVAEELKRRILIGGLPLIVPPDRLRDEGVPEVKIVADVPMFALALKQRFTPIWLRSIEEPSCWWHLVSVTWKDGEQPPSPFFIVSTAKHATGQYHYASSVGFGFTLSFLRAAVAAYQNNAEREEDFILVALSIPSLYLNALWTQYENPANDTVQIWRGPTGAAKEPETLSLDAFSNAVNTARKL